MTVPKTTQKTTLPTLEQAKSLAKTLRRHLAETGEAIAHGEALERVAKTHGFKDWNTFHAALRDRLPEEWTPGRKVSGTYLSRPFTATIKRAAPTRPGWVRLTLDLDVAVDVVTSERFSNLRKRISCTIGPKRTTKECTSDGAPHMILDH